MGRGLNALDLLGTGQMMLTEAWGKVKRWSVSLGLLFSNGRD